MPSSLALGLVGEVGELCANLQWKGQAEAQPGLPGWGDTAKKRPLLMSWPMSCLTLCAWLMCATLI